MNPFTIIFVFGTLTFAAASAASDDAPRASPPTPAPALTPAPTAVTTSAPARGYDDSPHKPWKLFDLPESDGLTIDCWAWFADLQNNQPEYSNAWDVELSFAITKSFGQRAAITGQFNAIDANGHRRLEVEQAFGSVRLSDTSSTIFTIGKFNANFGVEGRDFWNRLTGTPSLLFGAQPQDLVGAMFTIPIGETGLKLRPFVSADFQGTFTFNQPPAAGIRAEYRLCPELKFNLTNWVGPGFVVFGGKELPTPYSKASYGAPGEFGGAVALNWEGPNLYATRSGTLYFVDANVTWNPTPDLTLAAEFLLGSTSSLGQHNGWSGWMILGDYAITDRLHAFARWSYLDDRDWIITGIFQRHQEFSVGAGYHVSENMEVRAEYRYDYSNTVSDVNSVSIHFSFTF